MGSREFGLSENIFVVGDASEGNEVVKGSEKTKSFEFICRRGYCKKHFKFSEKKNF